MIPPQSRQDLPTVRMRRGAILRIHLSFLPRAAHVTVFRGLTLEHYRLRPGRTLFWRARASGVVSVDVRAAGGSAAYLTRLVLRS
jgi:hypothetical protein